MLAGKKTYILGALGLLTLAAQVYYGADPSKAMQDALTILMGMTIRHGIATK